MDQYKHAKIFNTTTLFGDKFEQYLEQPWEKKSINDILRILWCFIR